MRWRGTESKAESARRLWDCGANPVALPETLAGCSAGFFDCVPVVILFFTTLSDYARRSGYFCALCALVTKLHLVTSARSEVSLRMAGVSAGAGNEDHPKTPLSWTARLPPASALPISTRGRSAKCPHGAENFGPRITRMTRMICFHSCHWRDSRATFPALSFRVFVAALWLQLGRAAALRFPFSFWMQGRGATSSR